MLAVMGRYSPPCLFTETTDSINDIVGKTPRSFEYFCHYESSQMAAFLKTDILVVYAIACYLVLCEDSPGQSCPLSAQILLSIFYIALTHLLWHRVAPKGIVSLGHKLCGYWRGGKKVKEQACYYLCLLHLQDICCRHHFLIFQGICSIRRQPGGMRLHRNWPESLRLRSVQV